MGSDFMLLSIFHHALLLNFTIILAHVIKEAWWETCGLLSALLYEFLFLV